MPTHNPGLNIMGPPQSPPPGKWSWDAFKQKGQGLLADPNQLMQSPLFNMGMGLLSENAKPFGGDPFSAVMQGMQRSQGATEAEEDRMRIEVLRARLNQLIKQQMASQMPRIQPEGGGLARLKPTGAPPPQGLLAGP